MLVVQAFPTDFDPFKVKLYYCERERMSRRYGFMYSFFALPYHEDSAFRSCS